MGLSPDGAQAYTALGAIPAPHRPVLGGRGRKSEFKVNLVSKTKIQKTKTHNHKAHEGGFWSWKYERTHASTHAHT